MSTYEQAGVDISLGDESSRIAYNCAKATFIGRQGMIGEPVIQDGGFAGALDMGDFYLVMGDDGVGTKMEAAVKTGFFDTLGEDLLAMVADDAICVGAEVVAITNTIDVNKVNPAQISQMMEGLKQACLKQKITIAGGEIAELGSSLKDYIWNATAIGVLEKSKMIKGDKIKVGDKVLALKSRLFRSNGFSLVRYILKQNFGEDWHLAPYDDNHSWGKIVLTPSKIYHHAILEVIGRYQKERRVDLHGIAHITGGGIPGNLNRILKQNQLGAYLDALWEPQIPIQKIQTMGNVSDEEAYRTWNMGNGMLVVLDNADVERTIEILKTNNVQAKLAGEIIAEPKIKLISQGTQNHGKLFEFDL